LDEVDFIGQNHINPELSRLETRYWRLGEFSWLSRIQQVVPQIIQWESVDGSVITGAIRFMTARQQHYQLTAAYAILRYSWQKSWIIISGRVVESSLRAEPLPRVCF